MGPVRREYNEKSRTFRSFAGAPAFRAKFLLQSWSSVLSMLDDSADESSVRDLLQEVRPDAGADDELFFDSSQPEPVRASRNEIKHQIFAAAEAQGLNFFILLSYLGLNSAAIHEKRPL